MQPGHSRDRRRAVSGVPRHAKPLRFEQRPRRLAETLVVVNDQNSRAHTAIVTENSADRTVASTNALAYRLRAGTDPTLWSAPILRRSAVPTVTGKPSNFGEGGSRCAHQLSNRRPWSRW